MGKKQEVGASLVEVMVALFVLAIGLLGVLAMQSRSMQFNQSAYTYTQAMFLANDIAERIRSNASQANAYRGSFTTGNQDCQGQRCTAGDLVSWDKSQVSSNVERLLPEGKVTVTELSASPLRLYVTVSFDDSRAEGRVPSEDYDGTKSYSLLVEI